MYFNIKCFLKHKTKNTWKADVYEIDLNTVFPDSIACPANQLITSSSSQKACYSTTGLVCEVEGLWAWMLSEWTEMLQQPYYCPAQNDWAVAVALHSLLALHPKTVSQPGLFKGSFWLLTHFKKAKWQISVRYKHRAIQWLRGSGMKKSQLKTQLEKSRVWLWN